MFTKAESGSRSSGFLVLCTAIALALMRWAPCLAQGDPNEPQRDNVLSQVDDAFSMAGFEESFNPYSGHVTLRLPVIDLPGKAGLNVVLPAYYSTETYNRTESAAFATHTASIDTVDHLGGAGWQLHFGKVFNPAGGASPNSPLVVMPDGSTRQLFSSSQFPGELISEDRWRYKLIPASSEWELKDTRGTKYYFKDRPGFEQAISLRNQVIAQCVRVVDVFGNEINASYLNGQIQTITDSFGRTVQFNYLPAPNNNRLANVQVKNGATVLEQWTFAYTSSPLVTWTHPVGPPRQVFGLTSITPPVGAAWGMTYKPSAATFAQNRHALERLTLPTGGTITYTYTGQLFNVGCSANDVQRSVVATRVTGGRDVIAGTRTYTYSNPGDDGTTTTVTATGMGYSEVYVSEGYGTFVVNDPNLWSVGRLRSKTVNDSIQETEELYGWEEGDSLSGNTRYISAWVNCGALRQDVEIRFVKPVTVTRTVTRGTETWETTQSLFDAYGNPTSIDEDGNVVRGTDLTYWYSTANNILEGRVESRLQSPGSRECFAFNPNGTLFQRKLNPTTCGLNNGVTTTYTYDAAGQLTEESTDNIGNSSAPLRRRLLQNYSYGVPTLEVLPVIVTAMGPDVRINRLITPLGLVQWEEDGRQGTAFRTNYLYDALRRVREIDPPVGLTTTIAYAADGSSATVSRGIGAELRSFQTTFDGFGRKRTWEDLQRGDKEETSYDSLGRKIETQLYAGGVDADLHVFDDIGRLSTVDHPDALSIAYSYSGNAVTVTDEDGDSTTLNYEAFGNPDDRRLKSVLDAESRTWTYGYHATYGLMTTVTSPAGTQSDRSFTYTTNRFLDLENHPETGQIDHGYSNAGDRISTNKGSVTVEYDYDGPGRLYAVDAPTGTPDVEFIYDQASNATRIENSDARYIQTFDGAKRLTQRAATLGGIGYTSSYAWDGHDRLQTVTYPSGRTVTYTYDADGRVDGVETSAGGPYVSSITYTPDGGVDVITYGNGAFTDIDYDTRFRPTFIETQSRTLDLDYDPASRIDLWSTNGISRTFTYDDLGRIDTGTGPRGEVLDFVHNAVGNRTTLSINGTTETYTYTPSTQRLQTVTGGYNASYGYDNQGRLTSSPAGTFTWTALDRLATVSNGSTNASYAYDGEGRRVKATVNGTVRWFVLDPWGKILAEYNGAGGLLIEHVYLGDKRIASRLPDAGGTRAYVQHDPLGSSWIVTASTGVPYQIYDYWPFGEPVGMFDDIGGSETPDLSPCPSPTEPPADHVFCDNFESGNTLSWTCTSGSGVCTAPPGNLFEALFTGKKLDSETGLFYFEARHLDSRIGRFASPDQGPLVFENPQTFNRYAYATNSPYKYDDPDGKVLDTILDVGFIAYDLFDIGRSAFRGEAVSGAQWGALGADVVGAVVPFATGGGALIRAAAHADDAIDTARALGHADDSSRGGTYLLREADSGEIVRSGRTNDLSRRAGEHARAPQTEGFRFEVAHKTDDAAARRGLEQMLHDVHQPRMNRINPISSHNPNRAQYMEAAQKHLAERSPEP